MNWPWKRKGHLALRAKSPRLLHTALTLDEWLSSDSRVDYARRLYSDPTFRALLSVLHNEAPIPNPAAKPEALAGMAMFTAGYFECLNKLLALSVPPPITPSPPEATYEPEGALPLTEDSDIG